MPTKTELGNSTLLAVRMPNTIFGLLKRISEETHLSVSELIRRGVKQYLLTAPENLPLPLKTAIARLDINTTIDLIKDIRYIYHKLKEAETQLNNLNSKHLQNQFPPHTITILKELEHAITKKALKFDKYLASSKAD